MLSGTTNCVRDCALIQLLEPCSWESCSRWQPMAGYLSVDHPTKFGFEMFRGFRDWSIEGCEQGYSVKIRACWYLAPYVKVAAVRKHCTARFIEQCAGRHRIERAMLSCLTKAN
jgi:hypothetical protein